MTEAMVVDAAIVEMKGSESGSGDGAWGPPEFVFERGMQRGEQPFIKSIKHSI